MRIKIITLIAINLFVGNLLAQQTKGVDTIEVAINKYTVIIFPKAVKNVACPFKTIKKNVKSNEVYLLPMDSTFQETNLLVESINGDLWVCIIKYSRVPKQHKYFYLDENSKNDQLSNPISETGNPEEKDIQKEWMNCIDLVYNNPSQFSNFGEEKNKVKFLVPNLYVKGDYIYVRLQITNRSNLKYEVKLIKFYVQEKSNRLKKTIVNPEEKEILFHDNEKAKNVLPKEKVEYVLVFDKFSFGNDKELLIELWEKNGERPFKAIIPSKNIMKIKAL